MIFGQTKCVTCDTFVENDQCQPCSTGTFDKPLVGCTACINNCDICRDTITCQRCANGYELQNDGSCMAIDDENSEGTEVWMMISIGLLILILVIVVIVVVIICCCFMKKPEISDDSKIHAKALHEEANRDDDELIKKDNWSSNTSLVLGMDRTKAHRKTIVPSDDTYKYVVNESK